MRVLRADSSYGCGVAIWSLSEFGEHEDVRSRMKPVAHWTRGQSFGLGGEKVLEPRPVSRVLRKGHCSVICWGQVNWKNRVCLSMHACAVAMRQVESGWFKRIFGN